MADNILLRLGTKIKGESPIDGYEDWIQVHSWSWGATQSGTTHEGSGGGSGKVSVQNMTFTKFVDASTHDLIKHVMSGEHIPNAELVVMKAGGNPLMYFNIKMTDLLIAAYQTQGSMDGLERVSETISLNFAKVEVTYTRQEMDGTAGPSSSAGWDIRKNVAV
jgi:type VI secretion system secreted protein Hcp